MKDRNIPEELRKHEIAQCVTIIKGGGDLPKISVKTAWSTAEIYLHDAQVTGFQKNGEPPLLFMSRRSQFAVGKAIRGGRPQRLLFASTGTKDPKASDVLYIKELVAPLTVNTMPEGTLKAFANHGELGATVPADGGNCETVLAQFAKAGVDCDALATKLQDEGATSFVKSWNELMAVIASKSASLQKAA
jgi:transaldolase